MKNFALLCLLVLLAQPVLAQEPQCVPTITKLDISAQASVKSDPDLATVSAGVMTIAPTADAALKDNAKHMTSVFAALKKANVKDKDIQTSGLNVSPQYNYQENKSPQIIGYQASNNVTVILRDLKNVGPVLDTLVAQGANQINGPSFTIEEPDEIMDQARKEAVQKARKRAELYAAASGLKIKRILNMSEQANYGGPPMPMMAMKAMRAESADASSPVASGQVDVTVTVNVTFELGE